MVRARIREDEGLAAVCRRGGADGGLQWLWRARWRDRTRQEALADRTGASLRGRSVGGALGHWRTGAVRPGVEWLATGPRPTELGIPRPALWQMQGEAVCRAGEPSARAKTRRLRVLVVMICSPRPMRAVQRARLWAIAWAASQAALAAKRPGGMWFSPTPYLRSRMAFSTSAWRR